MTQPQPSATSSLAVPPTTVAYPLDGCLRNQPGVRLVKLYPTDGGVLDGAILGHAPARYGVVFSDESDLNLCSWLPVRSLIEPAGSITLVYDTYGATPPELVSAVGRLRRAGAERIILVGASQGAMLSLVTAAALRPPPMVVISLSAEDVLHQTVVADVVAHSHVPTLFVTARDDSLSAVPTPVLYRRSASALRRLIILPGSVHGTALLQGATGRRLAVTIRRFIAAAAHIQPHR